MMHNQPAAGSLLYNVYSEANRGVHLDSMFACVDGNKASANKSAYPACAVITDILELKLRPGPAGLLFLPVFPANEPTEIVGFATTSIHWEEVLDRVVPSYVSGLTCVVSTDTSSFTYEIQEGIPKLVGPGDLHRSAYDNYARSAILNDFMESGAKASATYTLTVYPTDHMFDTFTTSSPMAVALGFFAVIIICMFIFCFYDYLMRHEAQQQMNILEMKRRFVRFISHEIRTPLVSLISCAILTTVPVLLLCVSHLFLYSRTRYAWVSNYYHPSSAAPARTNRPTLWRNKRLLIIPKRMWPCGNMSRWTLERMRMSVSFCSVQREKKTSKDWRISHCTLHSFSAVAILNDLLNYDKLESGLMKLEADQVFIWDLISKTVGQLNIQAVNRKINLKLHVEKPDIKSSSSDLETGCSNTDLCVVGAELKLMQVLRNVVSNALKFTQANGTIEVTAHHIKNGLPNAKPLMVEDADGTLMPGCTHPRAGSVQICVKDDGVGMSNDQLAQLFKEGVQFDADKLQSGGGSGLGLHIARGMVETHEGTITARSEGLNMGTTFLIELPLYAFPAEGSNEDSGDKSMDTTVSTLQSEIVKCPKRFLVAEDSESSRKMLIRLLERSGHSCVPASNGSEAVTLMAEDMAAVAANPSNYTPIDAILIDFEMPVLNGPDATREIRDKLGFQGPILGVTGNIMFEDVDYFKEHGADEVFAKPISMDKLNKYLEQNSSWSLRRKNTLDTSSGSGATVESANPAY